MSNIRKFLFYFVTQIFGKTCQLLNNGNKSSPDLRKNRSKKVYGAYSLGNNCLFRHSQRRLLAKNFQGSLRRYYDFKAFMQICNCYLSEFPLGGNPRLVWVVVMVSTVLFHFQHWRNIAGWLKSSLSLHNCFDFHYSTSASWSYAVQKITLWVC